MSLTFPVESKILGPDGKPFVKDMPVEFDRGAPTDTVFLVPARRKGETIEEWAGRSGVIKNVQAPR